MSKKAKLKSENNTKSVKIRIKNNNLELYRCGVRVGDEYTAEKLPNSVGFWFVSPDFTQCVIYENDLEVLN